MEKLVPVVLRGKTVIIIIIIIISYPLLPCATCPKNCSFNLVLSEFNYNDLLVQFLSVTDIPSIFLLHHILNVSSLFLPDFFIVQPSVPYRKTAQSQTIIVINVIFNNVLYQCSLFQPSFVLPCWFVFWCLWYSVRAVRDGISAFQHRIKHRSRHVNQTNHANPFPTISTSGFLPIQCKYFARISYCSVTLLFIHIC